MGKQYKLVYKKNLFLDQNYVERQTKGLENPIVGLSPCI